MMYTDPLNKMLMDAWAGGQILFQEDRRPHFLCPCHLLSVSSGAPGGSLSLACRSHPAGKRWAAFNPEECRNTAPMRAGYQRRCKEKKASARL